MGGQMIVRVMLIFLALTFVISNTSAQSVALGLLEDVPGVYAGEPHFSGVRIAFQKKGSDWEAFPSDYPDQNCLKRISSEYPREVNWTIAFDGRNLGQVSGRTPKEFDFYSHVGLQ